MKMIKYFSLVLALFAGQSMASSYYGYNGYYSNTFQIRAEAQRLINAERSLLFSVRTRTGAYSNAARQLRILLRKTVALKNATYYRHSRYRLRSRMANLRMQFRMTRRAIAFNYRLRHSALVRAKLRNVRFKLNRLSRKVYAYHPRYRGRVVYWR